MSNLKLFVKQLLPPLIKRKLSGLFYGWKGNFSTWKEASDKSSGYDTDVIFNKVKNALLKVKTGKAVYERDSVIFDKVDYSFPLLAALSYAARKRNKLNVLDFGGSLGSSYYQNRNFFNDLSEFNWCIVEQPHFVTEGQKTFADDHLHFFYDIDSCLSKYKINVILLSGVLQYLEKPYAILDEIISKNIEYIIIDRAPLLTKGKDRITIQTVPKNIYAANYPCWILNENNILNNVLKYYDQVFDNELTETINVNNAAFKSFFFKKKQNGDKC